MKNITDSVEVIRSANGGATIYGCPWNDYKSTSFAKTWAHAVVHAFKLSIYDLAYRTIKRFVV